MTNARTAPIHPLSLSLSGLLLAALLSTPAPAQGLDCEALRARIDAGQDPDGGRLDLAIRQQNAELDRVRAYADESGCSGNSLFDDPDSPECHALSRREAQLRDEIARLRAEAAQGGGDDPDRRATIEQYNAACAGTAHPNAPLPTPDALVPIDPGVPGGSAPAETGRFAQVLCVRHCDGAYYPLAVDVPADQRDGMDRLCQAQCPNAESSAYTSGSGEDVAKAQAADGSSYSALPAAFQFQKATLATCSCRAPGASWAETLAKADAMIEAHDGDVTVTPEIQARMSRRLPPPQPAAAKPASARKTQPRKTPPPASTAAQAPNPGVDVTRAFRRSVPTL